MDTARRPYRKPVFVVGPPRAGTTLLQALLCANGPYFPMPETHFFSHAARDMGATLCKSDRGLVRDRLAAKAAITVDFDLSQPREAKKAVFEHVVSGFDPGNTGTFLEKTPRHVFAAREIRDLYPDARFVCLVREPRNVIASNLVAFGSGQSLMRLAVLYNRIVGAIARLDGLDYVRVVRYEDLLGEPSAVLGGLCAFLGVVFRLECLDDFAETAKAAVVDGETWKQGVVDAHEVRRDEPDKWRDTLKPNQAALVALLTRHGAARFGYENRWEGTRALAGFVADLPVLAHPHQWMRLFDRVNG